jgi:hypothetical protein
VRILGSIVQAFMLAMFDAQAHLRPCRTIGSELVCDHEARRRDSPSQEPPKEPLRRAAVSSTLNQDVKNKFILIDGVTCHCDFPPDKI